MDKSTVIQEERTGRQSNKCVAREVGGARGEATGETSDSAHNKKNERSYSENYLKRATAEAPFTQSVEGICRNSQKGQGNCEKLMSESQGNETELWFYYKCLSFSSFWRKKKTTSLVRRGQ